MGDETTMTTYRMLQDPTLTIEAERFDGTDLPSLIDIDGANTATGAYMTGTTDGARTLHLDTQTVMPDGEILYASGIAAPGDWIATNPQGEVFVVPADRFDGLFEPMPPDEGGEPW